ncbi:MAG: ferritin [Treponemataceae bacterium]
MISEKLTNALNEQIQKEMASAYLYLGMAVHFEAEGLQGFATWMQKQAAEEWQHAMKLYNYLFEVDAKPVLKTIPEVKVSYGSPKSVIEEVLKHEKYITDSINSLYKLALAEDDFKTVSFLTWFINEQVEEEASVNAVLDMFKHSEGGAGLMFIDRALGSREE